MSNLSYAEYLAGKLSKVTKYFDFHLIFALNLEINQKNWETYKSLLQLSNYIFLQEKACIICDRQIKMLFDNQDFLHAEGEPAIQFADGYGLYSHHTITLPKKYGELHSSQ